MLPENVQRMPWTGDFEVNHDGMTVKVKASSNGTDTSSACNAAFAGVVNAAIEQVHQRIP